MHHSIKGFQICSILRPRGAIARTSESIRPRVKKRDPGRAPLRGSSVEIVYPPQYLHTTMTKRSAEHAVTGQEDSLEITRDESASGGVFQEA